MPSHALPSCLGDTNPRPQIKSAEDLLQLTRLLRELWTIGPLRKPGEGEQEAEARIESEVGQVVGLLNRMREQSRQQLVSKGSGHGKYVVAAGEQRSTGAATSATAASQVQR